MEIPKCPRNIPFTKEYAILGVPCGAPKGEPHLGRPHSWGSPPMRCLAPLPLLEHLFGKSQKVLFQKIQNLPSLFTMTFFSIRMNWKYLCGLRIILVPTKIIFNAFWNNSRLVISSAKSNHSGFGSPEHFRFSSQKIPESFQNDSGTLQELSGMSRNQFDLMEYPETTFRFHRNYSDILSGTFPFCPKLFRWISLRLPV